MVHNNESLEWVVQQLVEKQQLKAGMASKTKAHLALQYRAQDLLENPASNEGASPSYA